MLAVTGHTIGSVRVTSLHLMIVLTLEVIARFVLVTVHAAANGFNAPLGYGHRIPARFKMRVVTGCAAHLLRGRFASPRVNALIEGCQFRPVANAAYPAGIGVFANLMRTVTIGAGGNSAITHVMKLLEKTCHVGLHRFFMTLPAVYRARTLMGEIRAFQIRMTIDAIEAFMHGTLQTVERDHQGFLAGQTLGCQTWIAVAHRAIVIVLSQ